MQCIYCLQDKSKRSFTKVEHVIPQAFGLFKNNFTLIDTVCDDCNHGFGNSLDLVLARDTIEGALRFEQNLKPPEEFIPFGKKSRIIVKFPDGELKGMYGYREYSPDQKRIMVFPIPQIGFLKGSSREYFPLDALPSNDVLLKEFNLALPQAIHYVGCDPNIADKLLQERGINFKPGEAPPLEGDEVQTVTCELGVTIDQVILRANAKIAFNYLAYCQNDGFVLHKDFNPIREFITTGKAASYPLVQVVEDSVLKDEPIQGKRRSGHMATISWALDGMSIVGQVSLMNHFKYKVSLARNFGGEHRNIRSGHFFNFHSKEIFPLTDNPES